MGQVSLYHNTGTMRRRLTQDQVKISFDLYKLYNLNLYKLLVKEPIPACSKGNKKKWSKMQCDPGTQYCWCVSPKTGIYDDTYRVIQKDRQLKCR